MPRNTLGTILDGTGLCQVDCILDMTRTITNITGGACVATIVAASEGQPGRPDLSEERDRIRVRA